MIVYPPTNDISTFVKLAELPGFFIKSRRLSEYLSSLLDHNPVTKVNSSSSVAQLRNIFLMSYPSVAKRQVNNRPLAERRSRLQVPQNGSDTDAIMPVSI